jgi:protoporphyrinogen oxidase
VIREKTAGLDDLYLTGCDYDGIGIPDCVKASRAVADEILKSLASAN